MNNLRIGVFADISNLYYCCGKKFHRKIDYEKYIQRVQKFGDVYRAVAYGAQTDGEAEGFITCLKHVGFEPKYKAPKIFRSGGKEVRKADWDVGIAMDIVRTIERLDLVILGSADSDLADLVDWVQERGIPVFVIACGISRELKQKANKFFEVDESLLQDLPPIEATENSLQTDEVVGE